jgi:hypothetical protein
MTGAELDEIVEWTPEERLAVIDLVARGVQQRLAAMTGRELHVRLEYVRALAAGSWEMLEHNRAQLLALARAHAES